VSRSRLAFAAALVGAAIVGAVVIVTVRGDVGAPVAPHTPLPATTTIVRTDLSTSVLTAATLGYAPIDPIINHLNGTYTALPTVGSTIGAGDVLYRVDNQPAVLMTGATPAWRSFTSGMTDGPDVTELQSNLISLGDAAGLFTVATGHFDWQTREAVTRWQRANAYPATGQIALGEIVFSLAAIRVGASSAMPGQEASPGTVPLQATSTVRTVTVPISPTLPPVAVGQTVSIVLPSGTSTPGHVTALGPAAASQRSDASTVLTITPDRPAATGTQASVAVQVSLTIQSVHHVLAAPIAALLAFSGGGYGLEIVTRAGIHHLVGVTTGVFADSQVQVSGSGIAAGTKVVVAQ